MEEAFWDTSSLVPVCTIQPSTPVAKELSEKYRMATWWATPVEVQSAIMRLVRMGQLSSNGQVQAIVVLDRIRRTWREIPPSDEVRERAERVIERHPLRAADAQAGFHAIKA